jgi:hypothetical protein
MVSPELLRNSTFNVDIVGDGTNLHWQTEPGSDPDPDPTPNNPGSSGGGCNTRMNSLIALSFFALSSLNMKKKH